MHRALDWLVLACPVLACLVLACLVLVPRGGQPVRVAHVEQSRGALTLELALDMVLDMVQRQGARGSVAQGWWARASLRARPVGVGWVDGVQSGQGSSTLASPEREPGVPGVGIPLCRLEVWELRGRAFAGPCPAQELREQAFAGPCPASELLERALAAFDQE